MRITKIGSLALAVATATALFTPSPAHAAAKPDKITNVQSFAGPGVGEVTITFKQSGANTTSFRVETALTSFSKTGKYGLPKTGRHSKVFIVPGKVNKITLSAAQVAAAGAAPKTANHLYFRLFAVNTKGPGTAVRAYPYLQAVAPRPAVPKSSGTAVRAATFNVRTAKASDSRTWLKRSLSVAREIAGQSPGLVAIQELGVGRADGKAGSTTGTIRQTVSLEKALQSVGAGRYRLVRTTPYVKAGTKHGSQGARILYDTSKYTLVSKCPETTGKSNYNHSCSIELPMLKGDSKLTQRSAAYAEFQSKQTGKRFVMVSAHLDARHSAKLTTEKRYNTLRGRQAAAIYSKASQVAGGKQIIFGGDLNSFQSIRAGNAPHDYLITKGFYDTAAAQTRVNFQYPTVNHFDTTLKPATLSFGVRIDVVLVKGSVGAQRFVNVMKRVDAHRPSDHNLVVADVML